MIFSHAKINVFLKIIGRNENDYHLLVSRFVKIPFLYDTISFTHHSSPLIAFTLSGFSFPTKQNLIYKAYQLLRAHTHSSKLTDFFTHHSVEVVKNIPTMAGLGGGSSNCASFLLFCNQEFDLGLSLETLCQIGSQLGSDIAFFLHGYESANVFGVGEIIEPFTEEPLEVELFTPPIACDTVRVYKRYKELGQAFFDNKALQSELTGTSSKEILQSHEASFLNDLLAPALDLYPALQPHLKKDTFFSGSGSTFFSLALES